MENMTKNMVTLLFVTALGPGIGLATTSGRVFSVGAGVSLLDLQRRSEKKND